MFLVIVMLGMAVLSCGKADSGVVGGEATSDTSENGATDSTTAATENVNTEPALNFGGKTFTLLHWDDGYPNEYFVEEQTGDLIADSVFLRNALVEERLGVEIEWIGTHVSGSTERSLLQRLLLTFNPAVNMMRSLRIP